MELVRIRLRKPRRVLSFLCEGMLIERDDACIVESDNGLEWGACVLPPEPCSEEVAKRSKMRLVRRATAGDFDNLQRISSEEGRAKELCQRKIEKHNLPMKLVDVEYTFDRHKVIFSFVADNRVDFRELVRDLAHELRQRIELRHIQVRDQAKMVGGLGTCGRQLCCATWLEEFKPISMRMAKCQNLSLNPSKISGQCGRLLCCLSYESDMYDERKTKKCCANADESPCAQAPAAERISPPAEPLEGASDGDEEIMDGQAAGGSDPAGNDVNKRKRKKKRKRGPGGGNRENAG